MKWTVKVGSPAIFWEMTGTVLFETLEFCCELPGGFEERENDLETTIDARLALLYEPIAERE